MVDERMLGWRVLGLGVGDLWADGRTEQAQPGGQGLGRPGAQGARGRGLAWEGMWVVLKERPRRMGGVEEGGGHGGVGGPHGGWGPRGGLGPWGWGHRVGEGLTGVAGWGKDTGVWEGHTGVGGHMGVGGGTWAWGWPWAAGLSGEE